MNAAPPPSVPDGFAVPAWRVCLDYEQLVADAVRKGTVAEWKALADRARTVRAAGARDQDAIRRIIAECEEKQISLRDSRIVNLEHHLSEMIDAVYALTLGRDPSDALRKQVEHASICLGDKV